jgi:Fe-S-cluster containining protein
MTGSLENYRQLVKKVDQLCEGITTLLGDALTCHAGCSSCCIEISVFPVEAAALLEAAGQLPPDQQKLLVQQLSKPEENGHCPLLLHDRCLLYQARPIICRTHGLPILITDDNGQSRMDVCPLNCKGLEQIPGEALINLERLNTLLTSINLLYLRETGAELPERVPISRLAHQLTAL